MRFLVRQLYSLLWYVLCPLYLLKLHLRGRKEPLYGQFIGERFGVYDKDASFAGTYIWLHAVSLGEMRAAAVLIEALRKQMPEMKLLLTTSTATGRAQGQTLIKEGDALCWLPIDVPGAVKRFLRHYRPLIGLLMETEIWPNLMHYAKRRKVPVLLVNARLSEKSLKGTWKARILLRPAYGALSGVLAQTHEDRRRLRIAGVHHGVQVVGNLKYDMQPDPKLLAAGQRFKNSLQRPTIMAASTRQGEEELLIKAWEKMQWPGLKENQRPLLLLVPRHPQRFDEVALMVQSENLSLLRRSALQDAAQLCEYDIADLHATDVLLGDSLGEMPMYYGMSDITLLGGSFEAFGGQNLIEALACSNPVIMGEHTYNFKRPCAQAVVENVAFRVSNFEQALEVALPYLQNADTLKEIHLQARNFVASNQGACIKIANFVAGLVRKQNS